MKHNLTELIFILDKSGSMEHLQDETIKQFNSLIESQKKVDGEAFVTTVLFDTVYKTLHEHVNLQKVTQMTREDYQSFGGTALLDAVGKTIDEVGIRLAHTPEEERPEKIIVAIMTDGEENASREYTYEQVKGKIEHQKEKYSWTFLFFGNGIDAVKEAGSLGISPDFAIRSEHTQRGIRNSFASMDMCILRMRDNDRASQILATKIEDMDLSVRTYNLLKTANIQTVEDLTRLTEQKLLQIKGFGRKAVEEVVEKLESCGFSLEKEED